MITLTEDDLLTIITRDELDEIAATDLESGQDDPIEEAIADALGFIRLFVDPDTLEDDSLKVMWRHLSVCRLYSRKGVGTPDKHKEHCTEIKDALKAMRDGGKLPPESLTSSSAYGGQTRISGRNRTTT